MPIAGKLKHLRLSTNHENCNTFPLRMFCHIWHVVMHKCYVMWDKLLILNTLKAGDMNII